MPGASRTALVLLLLANCTPDAEGGTQAPRGPDGGMIEWDAGSIGAPPSRDSGTPPVIEDGGSEPVKCTGIPTVCSGRGSATCSSELGCQLDARCKGFPPACYLQSFSSACYAIDGCYWSSSTGKCSGTARSCSLYFSDVQCEGQQSCFWDEQCTGVATRCSALSTSRCVEQPGCTLE